MNATVEQGVVLDVGALMDRARQETGLSDYGDDWFVEPLTRLVEFVNRDAGLPSADVYPVDLLVGYLGDRLKLVDYLKRHPEVRDEKVEVGPGDAILTGFHGIQSVDAIGEEPYRMLVIEALPPEIEAGLPEHRPSEEAASPDDEAALAANGAPAEQGAAA